MLKKIFIIFTLFFLASSFVVSPVFATTACKIDSDCTVATFMYTTGCYKDGEGYKCNPSNDTLKALGKIYCERRQGNQINLETWYGGKCDPDHPTNPDTIGFGDIIILDLYSKLVGEKELDGTQLQDIIRKLFSSKTEGTGYNTAQEIKVDLDKLNTGSSNDAPVGFLAGLIGKMYSTPPASTGEYFDYVASNINRVNPVQPAYAQNTGYGFQSIKSVLPVWRAFRNVAYLVFILVFVVYGFLIMFRVKISAQATANIQSALPKIAIVLLTITFSYAIVGLMIDLSYVVTGVFWSILTQANIIGNYSGAFGGDFLAVKDGFAKLAAGQQIGLAGPFFIMLVQLLVGSGLVGRILAAFMPPLLATILTTFGGGLIIGLILIIAVIFTLFRIAWMLLKAYVNLILATIFAPILLLSGVLPGNNSFANWFSGITAELSIFVATTFGLLFAFYFIGPVVVPFTPIPLFSVGPIDTGYGNLIIPPPLMGGTGGLLDGSTEGRMALLGIGIFFIIPGFADKIRKAFKTNPMDFSSDIGKALNYGYFQTYSIGAKFQSSGMTSPTLASGAANPNYSPAAAAFTGVMKTAKKVYNPKKPSI